MALDPARPENGVTAPDHTETGSRVVSRAAAARLPDFLRQVPPLHSSLGSSETDGDVLTPETVSLGSPRHMYAR